MRKSRYDCVLAGHLYKRCSDSNKWLLRWFRLYQVPYLTLSCWWVEKIQKELIWEQKFSKLVMEGWACKFYNALLLLYDYLSTFIRLSHSDWHKRGWFLHLDYLFRLWSCWIHFDPIFNLIQQSGRGTDEWKWKLWNSTGNPNLDFIIFVSQCKIKICQGVSDLISSL